MNNLSKKVGSLIAACCLTTSAHAADINWSGFGTIGVGQTLDSDSVYRTNAIAGVSSDQNGNLDDKLTFDALSIIALQASSNLGDGLNATVQIKAAGADSWDAKIEWAYLSYDLTPTLKVQAGRKLIPIYSYTDSIDVGYTYHWIRPPADVYSVPANKYDGVNLMYQDFYGDWEVSSNVLFGRLTDDENAYGSDNPLSYRVWGGSVEATLDDWATFRLAGFKYEEFDIQGDVGGGLELSPFNAEYFGAAVKLRPSDNLFIVAEYTWYETTAPNLSYETAEELAGLPAGSLGTGPIPDAKLANDLDAAWFVSAAYTMGMWTPHLTYSVQEFKDQGSNLALLDAGGSVVDVNTIIVGARYDFHPSASLKMEYHMYSDDTKTAGAATPRFGNDDDNTDAIQVAIDFIF
ncbi:porin [Oceanicoccus sp. KOV_DT_Chl]|uniref:porin n=1 Tax=Oceanicoccus sp. KOV_DT_Chl TaxID=1904639 RepID=UPI000C7D44A2|nr:porin [Oceanicoccus sp. KOV_DT_Chl]